MTRYEPEPDCFNSSAPPCRVRGRRVRAPLPIQGRPETLSPEIIAYLDAPAEPTAPPPPVQAGAGAPAWLLAVLAAPLAYAGYQEWEIRKRKKKRR